MIGLSGLPYWASIFQSSLNNIYAIPQDEYNIINHPNILYGLKCVFDH